MMRDTTKGKMRIVSLAPNATSILCSIGAKHTLVGVSKWCADVAPVTRLPRFGDCWHLNDADAIAALKPDLVIGSVPFQATAIAKLLAHPLNFLALNPLSIADIERDIRQLGAITARTGAAEKLLRRMRRAFTECAKVSRSLRPLRVYGEAWPNPRIASPPWVAELVKMTGNIFVPAAGARISVEAIVKAAPDVIVLAWTATGRKARTSQSYAIPEWRDIPAIRNRRVYVVSDELLNTPGPPLLRGLQELNRIFRICRGKDGPGKEAKR
jgi:iron complex transport system substrate-binding protein